MLIFILIVEMNCVRPDFSLWCNLKPWNFQCLFWAVFGSCRGEGGSSMGLSHSKAGVHSWEAAMGLLLSSVSSSPPPLCSKRPGPILLHLTPAGRGPSWGWYELGGSSCHDCPHVLETCCLPAETWCACLYPRQESTHAWWDARGAPGHHLCFRFANTHQWHSTGNLTTLSLMIFFTFVLKYSCGHTRSVQSKISSKEVLDTSNLQGIKCDTTA